jgi:hypothetical protein
VRHVARSESTPTAHAASGNPETREPSSIAVSGRSNDINTAASAVTPPDIRPSAPSGLAATTPLVPHGPVPTRPASAIPSNEVASSSSLFPAASSSSLFPAASSGGLFSNTSPGTLFAKSSAPAGSLFTTARETKSAGSNLFGSSSQAMPATGSVFGGFGSPSVSSTSPAGTSIGAAASIQRPFSGFGQSISKQPVQIAGSGLFGGGPQPASATKNDSANITGKSPQSKGTDTELLFLENDRGNGGKEQFQCLSSYVLLNKSFEVSACASISEECSRYTNKNPGA